MAYIQVGPLRVDAALHDFVTAEALPGSGVDPDSFWRGLAQAVRELGPRQQALLERRRELQAQIDAYYRRTPGAPRDLAADEAFLRSIGYLTDPPAPFTIDTDRIDTEISHQAGPQLVVPVTNARFATNAANARWGSLYDALYGTDAIEQEGDLAPGNAYNPLRGERVIARVRAFLDDIAPLEGASHADVTGYQVDDKELVAQVASGPARLVDPGQFVGFRGEPAAPTALLLSHHDLHVEIQVDRSHPIGATDRAGVSDVLLESAPTTIIDLEDSVAAIDADDKVLCYRNWLLLMQGTLSADVEKGGRTFTRRLHDDRVYTAVDGGTVTVPGRALMLVRHVGHLMTTDAVLDENGDPIAEGTLDAFLCSLGSCHDLRGNSRYRNSRAGSIYVVKPKLHGPDEVALTVDLFALVEDALGLPADTIKLGIMDEERRTTLNLAACVRAAHRRVAFINTGFLDRTGDEIHTSRLAGPVVRKNEIKRTTWIAAYERANVEVGLACGFAGRAQIGKGMWAAPDNLADMLREKVAQPQAGASTAWVPSPTAATLHALHYHQVDVTARQAELAAAGAQTRISELLTLALADSPSWTQEEIRAELDNNVQGVLGYVVRWIDAGVGCSKVPDLVGTPLMEDRATCRISSQHVTNWLLHGIITEADVEESLRRIAVLVDGQNADSPGYRPMAPSFDGAAFHAARDLLLLGNDQPSGYTEPILHAHRAALKAGN